MYFAVSVKYNYQDRKIFLLNVTDIQTTNITRVDLRHSWCWNISLIPNCITTASGNILVFPDCMPFLSLEVDEKWADSVTFEKMC